MIADDLAFATLPQLGAKLRSGAISAVELAGYFLGRLERQGPTYHCVVNLTRELALRQAAEADA
jgi:Asp-tRNA(Asn)/Glu-tRNA(Gln) amidotransferase A subunit family amidase